MLCASMNGALETALVTAYCDVMLPCVSAAGPEAEPVVVEASGAIIVTGRGCATPPNGVEVARLRVGPSACKHTAPATVDFAAGGGAGS